jgi:hypothetical protein
MESKTHFNKSYESLPDDEKEEIHYDVDSDAEPPKDHVGDKLTIIKKMQVTKTIIETGNSLTGKPGRPFIVKVSLLGYFAPGEHAANPESTDETTKKVTDKHIRVAADDIKERGEIFLDNYDELIEGTPRKDQIDRTKPIQLTIGDDRLPEGLWKAFEHMRKGERARIMVKPKHGYGKSEVQERMFFPRGWDSGENRQKLMTRRVFFDVKLWDWVVRHDLQLDGLFVKTIHERGAGFVKSKEHDEIKYTLKIYQRDRANA